MTGIDRNFLNFMSGGSAFLGRALDDALDTSETRRARAKRAYRTFKESLKKGRVQMQLGRDVLFDTLPLSTRKSMSLRVADSYIALAADESEKTSPFMGNITDFLEEADTSSRGGVLPLGLDHIRREISARAISKISTELIESDLSPTQIKNLYKPMCWVADPLELSYPFVRVMEECVQAGRFRDDPLMTECFPAMLKSAGLHYDRTMDPIVRTATVLAQYGDKFKHAETAKWMHKMMGAHAHRLLENISAEPQEAWLELGSYSGKALAFRKCLEGIAESCSIAVEQGAPRSAEIQELVKEHLHHVRETSGGYRLML